MRRSEMWFRCPFAAIGTDRIGHRRITTDPVVAGSQPHDNVNDVDKGNASTTVLMGEI